MADPSLVQRVAQACVAASLSTQASEREAAAAVLAQWAQRPAAEALALAEALLADRTQHAAVGFHALRVARLALVERGGGSDPALLQGAWERFVGTHLPAVKPELFGQCALLCATIFKLTWSPSRLPLLAACFEQRPAVAEAIVVEMDAWRCKPLGAPLEFHLRCHAEFQHHALPALLQALARSLSAANSRVLLAVVRFSFCADWDTLQLASHLNLPPACVSPLVDLISALPRVYAEPSASANDRSTLLQCLMRCASCASLPGNALLEAALRVCLSPRAGGVAAAEQPVQLTHVLRKCAQRVRVERAPNGVAPFLRACLDSGALDDDAFAELADEVFMSAQLLPLDVSALFGQFVSSLVGRHLALAQRSLDDERVADAFASVCEVARQRSPGPALETVCKLMVAARGQGVAAAVTAVVCAAHLIAPHSDSETASIPACFQSNPGCVALVTQLLQFVVEALSGTPLTDACAPLHAAYLRFLFHLIPVYVNAPVASPFDPVCGRGLPATRLLSQHIFPYLTRVVRHPHAPRVLRELLKCPNTGVVVLRDPQWAPFVASVVEHDLCWTRVGSLALLEGLFCVAAAYKSEGERRAYMTDLFGRLLRKQPRHTLAVLCTLARSAQPKMAPVVRDLFTQAIVAPQHRADARLLLKSWTAYCASGLADFDEPLWKLLVAAAQEAGTQRPRSLLKLLLALCSGLPSHNAAMVLFVWSAGLALCALGEQLELASLIRLLSALSSFDCSALWRAHETQQASVARLLIHALADSTTRSEACQCIARLAQKQGSLPLMQVLLPQLLQATSQRDDWGSSLLVEAAQILCACPAAFVRSCVSQLAPQLDITGMASRDHLALPDALGLLVSLRKKACRK